MMHKEPESSFHFWAHFDRFVRIFSEPMVLMGRKFMAHKTGSALRFALQAIVGIPSAFRPGLVRSQSVAQIYFTGVQVFPIMMLFAFFIGSGIVMQALSFMPTLGFGNVFGSTMVAVVIREVSPIFTALFVAGRSGAALTTYIGNMKVKSELDALETMGINLVRYIVLPALIGATGSLIVLNILFCMTSITGGILFAGFIHFINQNSPATQPIALINDIFKSMNGLDLLMIWFKPLVFGILISTICSYQGLQVMNDPRAVPRASSEAVVKCFFFVIVSDLLLSSFYIHQYLNKLNGLI